MSLIDTAGNLQIVTGLAVLVLTPWTPANWTGGFTAILAQGTGCESVCVQLDQNSSITAGAVNWVTIPATQVLDPTSATFAQIANPYTFVASTNKPFLIVVGGYQSIRALESTPMTGAGASITAYVTQLAYSPVSNIVYALPTGANTIGKVDILGNAGAILDGATGSAVPANGIYNGVRAATANPANATNGNLVGIMADKAGRLVVTNGHVRDLQGIQNTTIAASGTETTIITAGTAGVFNDLCTLILSGTGTAATVWTLRSATAGTLIGSFSVPVGATALPVIITFVPPLAQATAANNWTIQAGTGTNTGCQVVAQFIKNT